MGRNGRSGVVTFGGRGPGDRTGSYKMGSPFIRISTHHDLQGDSTVPLWLFLLMISLA